MSRIPTSSRTSAKPRPTPVATSRVRTTSTPSSPARTKPALTPQASKSSLRPPTGRPPPSPKKATAFTQAQDDAPTTPALSIREAIALKRAEAKKAQTASNRGSDDGFGPEALPDHEKIPEEEPDMLGRWSVRETIERARSTGNLNLASRSLPCIPSVLFDIHLGVTPEPLALVPNEPVLPPNDKPGRRRGGDTNVSWYEAQDLEVIKAGNNEILEIQPEISLFGSLKNIDLHNNKLTALPPSFADLMALTFLDLSHNQLTDLPQNLFAMPNLVTLNLSHNLLATLPFSAPFSESQVQSGFTAYTRASDSGSLFAPVLSRALRPLPALHTLNASHNRLVATGIDHTSLPSSIVKLDLAANPLGGGTFGGAAFVGAIARLPKLRELCLECAELSDDAFPPPASAAPDATFLPALRVLDAGQTQATAACLAAFLLPTGKEAIFDVTRDAPPEGTVRVIVGKQVVKEAWEIEAERRGARRGARWEPEVDEYASRSRASSPTKQASTVTAQASKAPARAPPKEAVKEAWEIEAENGLNTAGARRRARALAASTASLGVSSGPRPSPADESRTVTPEAPITPGGAGHLLSHSQYYNATTGTLTLPSSSPASRNIHGRSVSLAVTRGLGTSTDPHLALPTQTLPLTLILAQPLADNLRILVLAGRRLDPSFDLPADWKTQADGILPKLEELRLENCKLGDTVPVSLSGGTERTSEPLLPMLAALFPGLRTLDLSYNALTSAALTEDALAQVIIGSPPARDDEGELVKLKRKGLRHLRLRGNQLDTLDGVAALADRFRANRQVPGWTLEELDLRDNGITRLPAELGLLPLDVFLVDGNVFRIPQRRVWEREGTRGLLSWLRGRIE